MDIEKLIEQVNARGLGNGTSLGYHSGLFDEAATVLSMLQAENERLRKELEYEREHANAYHEECGQWEAEIEKLRAELERVKVERDAYQVYFKDLSSKPDCNTCEKRNCNYRPKLGATVRVNCPLYSGPQKEG